MRLPNYTFAAIRVAKLAGCRAARVGAKRVEPEHLLLALLTREGILSQVLVALGMEPAELRSGAGELVNHPGSNRRSSSRLSSRMEGILLAGELEARSFGSIAIKPEHLLLALLHEDGPAARFLSERGVTYDVVRPTIRKLLNLPAPSRCRKCAYDLRATPDRCPECGEAV